MKKLKLSTKIIGGFLLVTIISMIFSFFLWHDVQDMSNVTEQRRFLNVIIKESILASNKHLIFRIQCGAWQLDNSINSLNVQLDPMKCDFGQWIEGSDFHKTTKLFPVITSLFDTLRIEHAHYHKMAANLDQELKNSDKTKAMIEFNKLTEQSNKLGKLFNDVNITLEKEHSKLTKYAEDDFKWFGYLVLANIIVIPLLSIIIGIFLSLIITIPIRKVKDELIVSSNQINNASFQLSEASCNLAEGSSEQAAALEESSAALEELRSTLEQTALNSKECEKLTNLTEQKAEIVNRNLTDANNQMFKTAESGNKVKTIVKTIEQIAFQTNLLALNAAVEAARAGESGLGFAVVADEVRTLALQSAESAKVTDILIGEITAQIKATKEKIEQSLDSFIEMKKEVEKVNRLATEVTVATSEQLEGINQITKAVIEMDKTVQQNASSAEENASASEELSSLVFGIKDLSQDLSNLIEGDQG